jgi:lysyl endopeptidase
MNSTLSLRTLLGLLLTLPCLAGAVERQVASETSRTPPQATPRWKVAAFPARSDVSMGYREMSLQRLVGMQQRNTTSRAKVTQIGIGRELSDEGISRTTPSLRWIALKDGGSVARLRITSPDALGIRVGLQVNRLHPHVELRFGGSDRPWDVVSAVTAGDAQRLADAQGMYWSPATDGATQIVEVYRPAHVTAAQAVVQVPQLSHLMVNSETGFKIIQKVGESGSCNFDTVCRVSELGPAYVQAKNAVAHMMFNVYNSGGGVLGTLMCTGTLLNDTSPATQTPWFFSADHCFAGGESGIPVQDRATEAASLNTYWGYENSSCRGALDATKGPPMTGGADLMFYDTATDAMLLRLRNPAPASATFAGWDASPLPANVQVIGIHHPSGDAKKVSQGQQVNLSGYPNSHSVGWVTGTTERGSSGSGLFTLYSDGSYRLRGGLHQGSASCLNSGSIATPDNRDLYSRLDLIFPQIKQWIAADPVRENGSQPLVRTSGAVAQGQGARAVPAVATPAPVRAPARRERQIAPLREGVREP